MSLFANALESLFANALEPVVALDATGAVTFANPPGRAAVDADPQAFDDVRRQVIGRGEPARFEWGETTAAGIRRYHLGSATPMKDAGRVVGCLVVAVDATALKQNEARLRRSEELMVDTQGTAHLGTWEWDVSMPTATWSAELYRIYGLTPEQYEPSYEQYLTMVHPDDRQRVVDATNRVFHEHVPYSHDERIFRPDGTIRHLHTWARPVLDDNGTLVRLVGVCQDVTEQRLAEEHVRRVNAELEQRVEERTRTIERSLHDLAAFTAQVSHDLRAPLHVIQGSLSLMRKSPATSDARLKENLVRIERSVAHMTALVNDLLTLARVGNVPIERVDIDLSALAEELVANLRTSAPEREVLVTISPGLRVAGDAMLVRTAFENLIGNAWKYSSRVERARIEIGATEDGKAIFVKDNGAGFDMKDAPRLFEPFERLHSASEFEGTGVGLAAVNRIVDRHGGRIWADSAPGEGAAFFVELPPA